ncbi:unnamed protein product [Gongylonema pulchrum]|uniref:TBD domain-containing protein n=1 Tax=Gongylonema pulchrum TaxID=637853 RepID=A0A183EQT0_9BILA|nr:unnamed protein product [Gongylonema pulchrum]
MFADCSEELRSVTHKLDSTRNERNAYFDKFREYENKYLGECQRSRQLQDEVSCLRQRLLIEQQRNARNSPSQTIKQVKEKLIEKIESVNELDTGDPKISSVESFLEQDATSLSSSKFVLEAKDRVTVGSTTDEAPSSLKISHNRSGETFTTQESVCSGILSNEDRNSETCAKTMETLNVSEFSQESAPSEKRLKLQPQDGSSSNGAAITNPLKRKPSKGTICNRV